MITKMKERAVPKLKKGTEDSINKLIDNISIINKIENEKDIFLSEGFRLAFAFIFNAIKNKKFIAITGETGSGKTYLVRYLADFYKNDSSTIICNIENHEFIKVGLRQIYEALLFDIQPGTKTTRSNEAFIRQVKHILTSLVKENKKAVLIVDEAHRMNKDNLFSLKSIWESTYGFSRLISIVLIGQNKLSTLLNEPNNKEINNRIECLSIASIATPDECREYIKHIAKTNKLNISCIDNSAFEEIAKRQSSFLEINKLLKEGLIIAKNAGSNILTNKHFKHI